MAVDRPHRRPRPRSGVVALLLLAVAVAGPLASPAAAANARVDVASTPDGSFTPARVEIVAGDSVTWVWTANEPHTVTFEGDGPPGTACRPVEQEDLDCTGHRYKVTFPDAGEFTYRDQEAPFAPPATVVVKAPPPPKPTPTSPSPSPEPSPDPTSESPSPEPSPEPPPPSSEPQPEPEPEPSSSSPPPPAPTAGTAEPQEVETESASASESETLPEPSVAGSESPSPVPEPSFDDFPEAEEPTTEDDVEGEVAIGGTDDGDGTTRLVWGAIGGATVLGTLGAFGRRVLFADPWDA